MNLLTPEQLTEGRSAVLANAVSLLDDGFALFLQQRWARSYALTVLSREELGKLCMLIRASYSVAEGQSVDWGRLSRRMLNHGQKLRSIDCVEIVHQFTLPPAGVDAKTSLLSKFGDARAQQVLDSGKQDGLYVTVQQAGIRRPSEEISGQMANELYLRTRLIMEYFQFGEQTDPNSSSFAGIPDIYGKTICLAEDLLGEPETVTLPR